MRSLNLSRNRWEIKRIDLVYQNSTIFIGVCQCLELFIASDLFFLILQGALVENV